MVVIHGVAVPTPVDQCPSPNDLYPITAVRSVAIRSDDFYRYQDHLTAAGIQRACVVTTESLGADPEGWTAAMSELLDNVVPSYWFVGNECDAGYLSAHSEASDQMDPPLYARFWDAVVPQIRQRQPGVPVVTFGFVSGSPEVMLDYAEFCREADFTNIHPWGKSAAEVSLLLAGIRETLGGSLRFLIGEWNRPANQLADYVRMLHVERVHAAFFFSYHTFDVPGLINRFGQKTDLYDAYLAAIAQSLPEVTMGKLEETESKEWWKIGPAWKETGETEAPPAMEFRAIDGRIMRLRGYDYGVGMEVGSGTVYQPAEATEESFARLMANAIQKRPEVIKAALEAAGFRVVPV